MSDETGKGSEHKFADDRLDAAFKEAFRLAEASAEEVEKMMRAVEVAIAANPEAKA